MENDHEGNWDIEMPFVVVKSNGGPYDDVGYVAGYELGRLSVLLEQNAPLDDMDLIVRTANVPQLDLLAMQAGWRFDVTPWPDDESWSFVQFLTPPPDALP